MTTAADFEEKYSKESDDGLGQLNLQSEEDEGKHIKRSFQTE